MRYQFHDVVRCSGERRDSPGLKRRGKGQVLEEIDLQWLFLREWERKPGIKRYKDEDGAKNVGQKTVQFEAERSYRENRQTCERSHGPVN